MGHGDRSHALLSASGAHRWLSCTPSALLEAEFPDTTSQSAREGTLAHELAELKLRHYFQAADWGKVKYDKALKELKKHELWQDEMLYYTEEYLDHIKAAAMEMEHEPYVVIEKKVDLCKYIPGGFGTADCILIGDGKIHVIDFKYGQGVPVSAEDNPQMKLYALGAYEAYNFLHTIQEVKMTIVQPRVTDGISSWELSVEELLRFGEYVQERAALAIEGKGEYAPDDDTCRFCRAKAKCRARAKHNTQLAFFAGSDPALLSNDEIGNYLTIGAGVAKWLEDLKTYALSECLAGREVNGYKAVNGRGSRSWTDTDEALEALEKQGIDQSILWEKVPLTPPKLEKILGKKAFEKVASCYVQTTIGKPTLVPRSDKREAITNQISAAEAFGKEETNKEKEN